jgi:hypothetical protein
LEWATALVRVHLLSFSHSLIFLFPFSFSLLSFSLSLIPFSLIPFYSIDDDGDDVRAADLSELAGELINYGNDGNNMEHLLLLTVAIYPAESIWFIERRDS